MHKIFLSICMIVLFLYGCSAGIFAPPTRPSGNEVIEIPNKPTDKTEATESATATQTTESPEATETTNTSSTEATDVPAAESTTPSQPTEPTEPPAPTETTPETVPPTAPPEPTETTQPTEPDNSQFSQELLAAFQALRSAQALSPISLDPALSALAQIRVEEAGILWGHTRPNQTDFTTILSDHHYTYHFAAENLHKASAGYPAQWVLEDWLRSQTHKDNLLTPSVTHVGIGIYTRNGTIYTAFLLVAK